MRMGVNWLVLVMMLLYTCIRCENRYVVGLGIQSFLDFFLCFLRSHYFRLIHGLSSEILRIEASSYMNLLLFSFVSSIIAQVRILPSFVSSSLPCSLPVTSSSFEFTISNSDASSPTNIYFKSFAEQRCVLEFQFELPARTTRVIQAFDKNSFLAVDEGGRVYEGFRVVESDSKAWIVIKQTSIKDETPPVDTLPPPVDSVPPPIGIANATQSPRIIVSKVRNKPNPKNPFSILIAVLYAIGACLVVRLGLVKYKSHLREKKVIRMRLNPPTVRNK
jgi:hypothetical protein